MGKKISNHYDYWAGDSYSDAESVVEKLLVLRKSVSNFVTIATGQHIPIKFTGVDSKTDFQDITISTDPKIKNFDVTVGLALHEASHIKLTQPLYRQLVMKYFEKTVDTKLVDGIANMSLKHLLSVDKITLASVNDILKVITQGNISPERRAAIIKSFYSEFLSNPDRVDEFKSAIANLYAKHDITYYNRTAQYNAIENILEDRRIDAYMLRTCPGYRPYYYKLYNQFFYPAKLEADIRSKKRFDRFQEAVILNDETTLVNMYIQNLFGFMLKNPVIDIYPGMPELCKLVDMKNIGTNCKNGFDITILTFKVLDAILDIVAKLIQANPIIEVKQNDAPKPKNTDAPQYDLSPEDDAGKDVGGEKAEKAEKADKQEKAEKTEKVDKQENDDNEETDDDANESGTDSSDDSGDDTPDTADNSTDASDADNADSDSDSDASGNGDDMSEIGEVGDVAIGDKLDVDSDSLTNGNDNDTLAELTKFASGESPLPAARVPKDLAKKLHEMSKMLDSGQLEIQEVKPGRTKYTVAIIKKVDNVNHVPGYIPQYNQSLDPQTLSNGRKYGIQLGRALKTYAEKQELISNRLRSGKLDKRMIASGNFQDQIFSTKRIIENASGYIELTVDASGSMGGVKWEKTCEFVLSLAIACKAAKNIDLRVNYRSTDRSSIYVVYIYNSKTDSIAKLEKTLGYVDPNASTPEALCYEATLKNMKSFIGNRKGLFITITDGQPSYDYDRVGYTRAQMAAVTACGYDTLALFLSSNGSTSGLERFKEMYGACGHHVNPDEISKFASIINKVFIQTTI